MSEPSSSNSSHGRETSTRIGFILWRGGLMFCAAYVAYRSIAVAAEALLEIGVPLQIVVGVGLVVVGVLLLIASLIVERIIDARAESGLLND